MNLREHLVDDAPSVELTIYGADEQDDWIDDIKHERPDVKISLSTDLSLETLQHDEAEAENTKKASLHVFGNQTEEKAITKATDDALKDPDNTTVVVPDKDDNNGQLKEAFAKMGTTVVGSVEDAAQHLKKRL